MVRNNTGGPHGIGDPEDKSLRKVEMEVCIPKILREQTKIRKCPDEVKDFQSCCKEKGLLMWALCRKENTALKDCQMRWYNDEELKAECTEIYLKERTEFRKTGLTQKQREYLKTHPNLPPH